MKYGMMVVALALGVGLAIACGNDDDKIEDCAALCKKLGSLSDSTLDCIGDELESGGYPVKSDAACYDVEDETGCDECTDALSIPDSKCKAAYSDC